MSEAICHFITVVTTKKKCNVCTLLGTQEYLSPGNLSHNLQYCKERIELYIYCQKISSKISCVLPKSI